MSHKVTGLRASRVALSTAVATVLGTAMPAVSQELEEVIVTATKRAESVNDVPLAITALSGDFIMTTNLNDVKDLVAYTPGVSGNSQDSFIDAISVRGVRTQDFGIGGDPSSGFFKNDLYEGRNGAVVTSLYDMERAEILRGPQNFLFGRNAIGGAFSVYTNKAEIGSSDAYVDFDVGQRGHLVTEGAINIPVNDNFAMRLAGYYSQEDGFARNVNGNRNRDEIEHEKWALRWSTTFETEKLSLRTHVEYEDRVQSGSMYRAIDQGDIWETFDEFITSDATLGGSSEDLDSDISHGEADDATVATFGLFVEYDLGFATLISNTGYKDHDYYYSEDYDGTPLDINTYQQDQAGDYFQQEFRLISNSDGPLNWYTGLSYYREEIDTIFTFIGREDFFCQFYGNAYNPGYDFTGCADLYAYYGYEWENTGNGLLTEPGRIVGKYTGWSAYATADYDITDTLNLELGVRYTEDKKDFAIEVYEPESALGSYWAYGFNTDGFISETQTWDDTNLRAMLTWTPTEDGMFFASYTEGFKSGGYSSFFLVDAAGQTPEAGSTISQSDGFRPADFNPEVADSYEIGYKDSYLGGAGNFDLTAFMYDYEGLQIVYLPGEGGAGVVGNVGQVDGYGLEASTTVALNDNWTLYLAAGYLNTEANGIEDICGAEDPLACEGSPLFWAPEWTGAARLDANFPIAGGAITGSFEASYESERGGDWSGVEENYIDPFTIVNLRVGYESDSNWYVRAYAENLFDEFTWDGQNLNGGIIPSHFFGPMRPLTFGVMAGMSWD